jgi:hypothetical protein
MPRKIRELIRELERAGFRIAEVRAAIGILNIRAVCVPPDPASLATMHSDIKNAK